VKSAPNMSKKGSNHATFTRSFESCNKKDEPLWHFGVTKIPRSFFGSFFHHVEPRGIDALTCNFETDWGTWTTSGNYYWTRQKGRTPSSSTGPASAYEGEYYTYVEAAPPIFLAQKLLFWNAKYNMEPEVMMVSKFGISFLKEIFSGEPC